MRYLTTAFNDGPVKRDTRKMRDLILSDWYRTLWPEVSLSRTGETSFANTDTGTREGVAFGSLTSQRGDRLIIDDPHSIKTAESDAQRIETIRLFREGALNRLNDQEKSAIVIIMQRIHEHDISGEALRLRLGFVHLRLPMEFEHAQACATRIGFKDWRTYEGELLDPVRFPREVVEALKAGMGAHAYAGQYQQRPAARAGGMFQRSWFKIIDAIPAGITRRVRRWDLAASVAEDGEDPDWTVGLRMATDDKFYYIEHVDRFRRPSSEVRRAISNTASIDTAACDVQIPEDPGQAGKDQSQSIIAENAGYRITAKRETGDKGTRAEPLAAQFGAGNVFLLRGDWNEDLINEYCAFPKGHDDQVDAGSGAFNYLAGKPASAFFDTDKMLVRGYPVGMPLRLDSVFAVISTGIKTGKEASSVGVVYFGRSQYGGHPLSILDWDIAPVDSALMDGWFKDVFLRLDVLGTECKAESGSIGVFIQNKDAGTVLLRQGERRNLPVIQIEDALAKLGKNERAMGVSGYIEQGMVKITNQAFDTVIDHRGQARNHLLDQTTAFRIDAKEEAATPTDLLNCLMFGIALALGNAEGS